MAKIDITKANILIVDDDEANLLLLSTVLEMLPCGSVLSAKDGAEALDVLANAGARIHAMITDIDMPVVNGWQLVRKVRLGAVERYKNIPIFMLTANNSDQNQDKAAFNKISDYIIKPPSLDTIRPMLLRAFAG